VPPAVREVHEGAAAYGHQTHAGREQDNQQEDRGKEQVGRRRPAGRPAGTSRPISVATSKPSPNSNRIGWPSRALRTDAARRPPRSHGFRPGR
jgi:hypothetical protein